MISHVFSLGELRGRLPNGAGGSGRQDRPCWRSDHERHYLARHRHRHAGHQGGAVGRPAAGPLASAFRKSRLASARARRVEEDPEYQFRRSAAPSGPASRQAKIDPAQVAAIGIDGQMAGILGVGEDGRHVTPYDSWLDTRCCARHRAHAEARRATRSSARRAARRASITARRSSGGSASSPDVYRRIAAFVQPGGYAACGCATCRPPQAFIDTTYLHFSGFADNVRGPLGRGPVPDVRRGRGEAAADRRAAGGGRRGVRAARRRAAG